MNKEISRFFRTFVSDRHTNWAKYIDIISTCINKVHHETTQETLYQLQLGKKPTRMWQQYIYTDKTAKEKTHEKRLALARERIKKRGSKRNQKINAKIKKIVRYNLSDEVLLRTKAISSAIDKKIAKMFVLYTGPFVITKIVHEHTYILSYIDEKKKEVCFMENILNHIFERNEKHRTIKTK